MQKYLVLLIFIISVALAAGTIILSVRLKNRSKSEIFSSLLYFQVFIYTFGFYGIWGQVVIRAFLAPYINDSLMNRFCDIAILLGLPFLVFAWLMLIKLSSEISGRKYKNSHLFWFLLINFVIIFSIGYTTIDKTSLSSSSLIKYYFMVLNMLWSSTGAIMILSTRRGKTDVHDFDRKIIASGIMIIMVIIDILLLFYDAQFYLGLAIILVFFTGYTFIPLYFSYGSPMSLSVVNPDRDLSFDQFCKKFEVSPRESDIIREICNGLSNKEISDKLFISLQTVKDHTHRIYIKTNVKSRVQLINLVKENIGNSR